MIGKLQQPAVSHCSKTGEALSQVNHEKDHETQSHRIYDAVDEDKEKVSYRITKKRIFFIVSHILLISCARNEAGSKSYLKTAEGLMYRVSELTYLRDMLGTKSPKHALTVGACF